MPQTLTPPLVTVVIPAYKRTPQLELAIRSIMRQSLSPDAFEVFVVDSSPDTDNQLLIQSLQTEASCRLTCLRKIPEGPGPSRNLGARTGSAHIVAFMDSDCIASKHWLREGVARFQSERIGLVQGRTLPEPGVAHSVFSWSIQVEEESFLYETANIFYRREAFEAAGGFLHDLRPNSERPLGGEDVDLAWKVKRLGWQSTFVPEALVHHEVVRISIFRWFVNFRLYLLPKMVREYPELRRFLAYRYFFGTMQIWTLLALVGVSLTGLSAFWLILAAPYLIARSREGSKTLRGPARLLRALLYAPRDLASLLVLAYGSLRFRTIVL